MIDDNMVDTSHATQAQDQAICLNVWDISQDHLHQPLYLIKKMHL